MLYEIEPLDNFFFRTSAPFEAGGETTVTHGGFLPQPSAYAGAFKTLLEPDEISSSRGIRIGFNGLAIGDNFYFPIPLDLNSVQQVDGKERMVILKHLGQSPLSSYPLTYMLRSVNSCKDKSKSVLYLSEKSIAYYLQGGEEGIGCLNIADCLVQEKKMGIEVDACSGTSKDGRIYEVSYVRPALNSKLKLAVDVKADLRKNSGVLKLGGENKQAVFRPSTHPLNIESVSATDRYFKIYLATPAIFANGWFPGWIDENTKTGYYSHKEKRVTVRLIAACVGRSIPCGSFGYGREAGESESTYRPRVMRYAAQAGSVYYFELLEGSFADAVKLFHGKCISDYRESLGFRYPMRARLRYCDRGFGYAFVGKLGKNQEEMLHV